MVKLGRDLVYPHVRSPQYMVGHHIHLTGYHTFNLLENPHVQHPLDFHPMEILPLYRDGNPRCREP